MENLLSILPVLATDLSLTDFTFWIGFAAMFASTLFFFSAMNLVADKWKTSMLSFSAYYWYCSSSLLLYEKCCYGR